MGVRRKLGGIRISGGYTSDERARSADGQARQTGSKIGAPFSAARAATMPGARDQDVSHTVGPWCWASVSNAGRFVFVLAP